MGAYGSKKVNFTEEDLKKIVRLYREGYSFNEIARIYKCSWSTIRLRYLEALKKGVV